MGVDVGGHLERDASFEKYVLVVQEEPHKDLVDTLLKLIPSVCFKGVGHLITEITQYLEIRLDYDVNGPVLFIKTIVHDEIPYTKGSTGISGFLGRVFEDLVLPKGVKATVSEISQAISCIAASLDRLIELEGEKPFIGETNIIIQLSDVEKKSQIIEILIKYFESKYRFVTTQEGTLYAYDSDKRFYVPYEEKIKREIREIAEEANLVGIITRYVVNEVVSHLKERSYRSYDELRSSKYWIGLSNGFIIDMKTWITEGKLVVRPSTPDIFVRTRINAPFNRGKFESALKKVNNGADWLDVAKELCPKIHAAFESWVEPENVRGLYEIIGYTLYPEYPLHKMFMLLGNGANGKSTYGRLIERFLGKENVSHVSLQDLVEHRFMRVHLVGKLANIYPDIPKRPIKETGVLKALTGEDTLAIDVKHRKGFEYLNYAKMIFSANELPKVSDDTYGYWRRWIVVKFTNRFDGAKADPMFLEKISTREELEGLLVVVLLALRDVIEKREFSIKGDVKELWLREVDSVYAFLKDLQGDEGIELSLQGRVMRYRAHRDPNARIPSRDLYMIYVRYVQEYLEKEPVNRSTFTKRLEQYGIMQVKVHGKPYYKGILIEREEHEAGSSDWF